jgi:oligopeptidase B
VNRRDLLLSTAAIMVATGGCATLAAPGKTSAAPAPPVARREPKTTIQLGRKRVDDYAWLRDPNYQVVLKDPAKLRADIRAHLEAENAYSDAVLASTQSLQATLIAEMRSRIQPDADTAPKADGPWLYFSRYAAGAEEPTYLRTPREGGLEQVLLDANALARRKSFFHVEQAEHSPDHAYFAYAVDETGSEYYHIRIRELSSGRTLAEASDAAGQFVFSPDSKWLFWSARDERGRPHAIVRRPVHGGPEDEQIVCREPDEGLSMSVDVSSDRRFILITAKNQDTSETRLIRADEPTAAPRLLEPRRAGVLYRVDHWGDRFVILTNDDDAIDYKIMWADDADLSRDGWRQLIPHRPGHYIVDMALSEGYLARLERVDALDRIVVRPRGTEKESVLDFDEEAFALALERGLEFASPLLRYAYQSPVTPPQWWDHDMSTGRRTLVKQEKVPGYDPALYVVKRLSAGADDGEDVPITVLMKRGTPLDASAPLFLFGYGSYGLALEPVFSNANVCLIDRGWICATAHLRGGSDKGWGWFLDGRRFTKKNTFTDYIACAEHLCRLGYAKPGRILAYGRSAGGMLMGAVLNMRPDLWVGVLAGVPFVDVINTMSDVTLPLTPPEWLEWGNPLKDPKAYDYMMSYSPYDNVRPTAFPPVLATCGLTDPRVTYWEPAKWVAKLRTNNTGQNPILLHINMSAGHRGAQGRYDALKDAALNHAFAIWAMTRPADRIE